MPARHGPAPARTYLWWVVLGLVGLDYFSSLAYLSKVFRREVGMRVTEFRRQMLGR